MKRKLNFKNKKIWLSLIGTMSLVTVPILVSSCSTVSQTAINNSFLTSPDGNLTSNISLKDISTMSLKDPEGMKSYINAISKQITYNWLLEAIKSDKKLKATYDAQVKKVNDDYDDQVKSYKKEHGADWALKFQQEVLDKNGGTEEAYKNSQMYDYAKTQFTTEVLKNLFLGVFDKNTNKIILDPTQDQILDGLYGISKTEKSSSSSVGAKQVPNITYKFDSNTLLTSNDTLDPQYAAFQDYLFSQFVQYTNPYIVNMSLWKYGTPALGITNYYNIQTNSSNGDNNGDGENGGGDGSGGGSDSGSSSYSLNSNKTREGESGDSGSGDGSGDSGTTTPTTGTYVYPYFGNENQTNAAFGTLTKFTKFLEGSSSEPNYITNTDLGLKDIPLVYTEDSSTYILAKNSSIFSDLYTEFAAGATYLYGILGTSVTGGASGYNAMSGALTNINTNITHNIDLTKTNNNGLDIITSNFVSKTDPYTSVSSGVNNKNFVAKPLQLSTSLINEIINTDGPLKSLGESTASELPKQDEPVYVIDNFVPGTITISKENVAENSNKNNLSEYMFLRNQAGVHAISIDGSTLIGKATSEEQRKQYASDIVLYRYLMGSKGNATFKVDLNSELSSFLSANFDWLVYNYATSSNLTLINGTDTNNQNMFNVDFLNEKEKTLASAISNFLPNLNYYRGVTTASQKMMEAKSQYNSNYGYDTYKNGFAAPWSYNLADETKAKANNINKNFLYENALLSATGTNPYSDISKEGSLYSNVINAINSLVSTGLEKQSSTFEGYKYSQYLYSNNYYVNAALNTTLANTSLIKASIENNIYKEYLGDFINVNDSKIDAKSLQNGLYNFFFLNSLNSETNKWFSYNPEGTPSDVLSKVKNYSYQLWNDNNTKDESSKITNYNSIYSLLATAKYLIGEDGSYSNLLNYLRSTIGNQKAYFVWENSINTNLKSLQPTKELEEQNSLITSKSLIEVSTLAQNINNQFSGAYFGNGNSTTTTISPLTNNLSKDALYQTTANTSYYSTTTNNSTSSEGKSNTYKVGYKGLQLSTGSSISTDVTNALFTKPTDYNIGETGILAAYGSLDNLIKTINNIPTLSQLSTFINTLEKALNYKYDFNSAIIGLDLTLSQKKEIVTKNIQQTLSSSGNKLFEKFTGYVGKNNSTNSQPSETNSNPNAFSSSSNSASLYGAYAIQVTANDFSSISTLRQALKSENADDLINQLVVQFASSAAVQKLALSSIIGNKQVEVFDVRVKDAFGADGIYWLKNYK